MDAHDAVYAEGERAYAPHCNSQVLHVPGVCEFCDEYPDWQQARILAKTEFSPTDLPWAGNRPEGYSWPNEIPYEADHSVTKRGWYCTMPDGHGGTSCALVRFVIVTLKIKWLSTTIT